MWDSAYTSVTLTWSQGSGSINTTLQLGRYAGHYSASSTAQETVNKPSSPHTDTPPNISSSSPAYQYRLVAANSIGQSSALSNVLSPPQAPPAPANVVAKWSVDYTQATVTWDAADHADTYEVLLFRTTLIDGPTQLEDHTGIVVTRFQEPLAGQAGIWYQYQVIGHNRFGSNSSALSNALSVQGSETSPPSSLPPSAGSPPTGPTHPVIPTHPAGS